MNNINPIFKIFILFILLSVSLFLLICVFLAALFSLYKLIFEKERFWEIFKKSFVDLIRIVFNLF
ncbi:hypothetical protein AL523_13035 [Enterococcus gallinarum]|nr:hypothetical protein AL523_13035 [Enterococcus gallinarum]GEB28451.1 hypothetical protein ECA02_15460 [Enterococcus casseliflavus]STP35098.1 Uncharacterised protein [Enterococcus casseliflavus]